MPGRRAATVLSILVAGASVLATGAPPTPPPAVTDDLAGQLELTAESPIVVVDIAVEIAGPAPTRTVFTEELFAKGPEPRGWPPVVVRLLDEEGRTDRSNTAGVPQFANERDVACAREGPCVAHYTLVAILADPTAAPSTVTWTIDAGSHFPGEKPPAGATLELTAAQPVRIAAERVTFLATERKSLTMGAGLALVRRSFRSRCHPATPTCRCPRDCCSSRRPAGTARASIPRWPSGSPATSAGRPMATTRT